MVQTIRGLPSTAVVIASQVFPTAPTSGADSKTSVSQLTNYFNDNIQLPSTDKVTGLNDELQDKASLSGGNDFNGSNTFHASNSFESGIMISGSMIVNDGADIEGVSSIKEMKNTLISNQTISATLTAASGTLTPSQIIGGKVIFNAAAGVSSSWQMPTGDDIEVELGGINTNRGFFLTLVNQSPTGTITFTTNTNLTFAALSSSSLSVPPNSAVDLCVIRINNTPTYTLCGPSLGYLTYEQNYSHNTTWQGIFVSGVNGNCTITKVGNIVTMKIPSFSGVADITGSITMVNQLPVRFRPTSPITSLFFSALNGTNRDVGVCEIQNTGDITLYYGTNFGDFTSGNSCGLDSDSSITWMI